MSDAGYRVEKGVGSGILSCLLNALKQLKLNKYHFNHYSFPFNLILKDHWLKSSRPLNPVLESRLNNEYIITGLKIYGDTFILFVW